MSSLNATGPQNRPTLVNKVVDLSSWKIESISRIGLPNPTKMDFWGGWGF